MDFACYFASAGCGGFFSRPKTLSMNVVALNDLVLWIVVGLSVLCVGLLLSHNNGSSGTHGFQFYN